jgi:hypothetical protein
MVGNTYMSLNALLCSERRTTEVIALVLLPVFAVVLSTAGAWAALVFVAYAIIIFVVGYGIVSMALPEPQRKENIILAPAVGLLAISATTAFWARLALPLEGFAIPLLALTAAGAICLWRDRPRWTASTVSYGGVLVLLSVLICAVYLLPSARRDAVLRPDGSYNWMYVDNQCHHMIAANIKSGNNPPKTYGTSTAELFYHFGPYAPSAFISRFAGVELGDAFARVTRGASLWALLLSCFGVGMLLSLKATGQKFGGILCVAGFFFYGSLLSLFTDEKNSSSLVRGAILFNIPGVWVQTDGGPFSHLTLGHSTLHGMAAICAIMGLCLAQRKRETVPIWRSLILLALPALALAVHSVGALYCLGVAGILLFWDRLGQVRSWLQILLMFALFLGALEIMGYGHSTEAGITTIDAHPEAYWWILTIWFIVGLGFRIVAFRWISKPWRDPISALVLASVVCLVAFNVLVHTELGDEWYGLTYLQSLLSIFAFSLLSSESWRGTERCRWAGDWLNLASKGLLIVAGSGLILRAVLSAAHSQRQSASFRLQIIPCFLLALFLAGVAAWMKRSRRFSAVSSAVLMSLLAIGFLAWITPWLNFGLGRMQMDVTLSAGEVQGLKRLNQLARPTERFATNKHAWDNLPGLPMRSYAYEALSERPVLLEGYEYRGVSVLPWFKCMLHDNDAMFSTTDPQAVREFAEKWHVRWLVARPGTDIAVPRPLPPWLSEQPNCGDLKIYRID